MQCAGFLKRMPLLESAGALSRKKTQTLDIDMMIASLYPPPVSLLELPITDNLSIIIDKFILPIFRQIKDSKFQKNFS